MTWRLRLSNNEWGLKARPASCAPGFLLSGVGQPDDNPAMPSVAKSLFLIAGILLAGCGAASADGFPVRITVHADEPRGALKPIWRYFGYDEANYTYMQDGRKLLTEISQLDGAPAFIRCHHLLTSGDGAPALKWGSTGIYHEDAGGKPVYDWTIVDRIFDTYLERGLKPYAQIGFMPRDLSSHPQDYPQNPPAGQKVFPGTGFSYPPRDYAKWGELVYQWTHHCVEKYGADEVAGWYWEVWNEPNINYWRGTPEEYFKLYDYAVDAVRRALPRARVGGPETAGGPGGKFLAEFLAHCARGTNYVSGKVGSPLDFISFHAKGSPRFVDGHVQMGMAGELRNVSDAFSVIAAFPEYRRTPIVIGECDPEGCAACQGEPNAYRNGTMYSSYTAASFPRLVDLADRYRVNLEGALTWAFEFEHQPPFAGFRALASDGIDLPVLNVFRLFARMRGDYLRVESSQGRGAVEIILHNVRAQPDVSAQASLASNQLAVLVWHYHDDDVAGPAAAVGLNLEGLPVTQGKLRCELFRVDEKHSNAFAEWLRMKSPSPLTPAQHRRLEQAGQLAPAEVTSSVKIKNGSAKVDFTLPRQGVSLLLFSWR